MVKISSFFDPNLPIVNKEKHLRDVAQYPEKNRQEEQNHKRFRDTTPNHRVMDIQMFMMLVFDENSYASYSNSSSEPRKKKLLLSIILVV